MERETQEFNGKTYYLYKGEKYFSKSSAKLHRVVWTYHNGVIPKNYHVHHINGITTDNRIENLALVFGKLHNRFTMKKRVKENPDWFKDFQSKGIEAAKLWHKSKEGLEWHSKQGKQSWVNRETHTKMCIECGGAYETYYIERSKYCHNNCKAKHNRRIKKNRAK